MSRRHLELPRELKELAERYRSGSLSHRSHMRQAIRATFEPGEARKWVEDIFSDIDRELERTTWVKHEEHLEFLIERRLTRGHGVQARRETAALLERLSRR